MSAKVVRGPSPYSGVLVDNTYGSLWSSSSLWGGGVPAHSTALLDDVFLTLPTSQSAYYRTGITTKHQMVSSGGKSPAATDSMTSRGYSRQSVTGHYGWEGILAFSAMKLFRTESLCLNGFSQGRSTRGVSKPLKDKTTNLNYMNFTSTANFNLNFSNFFSNSLNSSLCRGRPSSFHSWGPNLIPS